MNNSGWGRGKWGGGVLPFNFACVGGGHNKKVGGDPWYEKL